MIELLAIWLAWIGGYAWTRLALPAEGRGFAVAAGYGVGLGLVTAVILAAAVLSLPLDPIVAWTIATILGVSAVAVLGCRGEIEPRSLARAAGRALGAWWRWPALDRGLSLLLLVLLGLVVWIALYWPVHEHDALTLYDLRARFFARAGSLAAPEYLEYGANTIFPGRLPPLTSFAHLWLYLLGGQTVHALYPPFYASLVLAVVVAAHRLLPRPGALLAGLSVAASPLIFEHATIAYTNLPFTLYFTLAALLIVRWLETDQARLLPLAGLVLGLSAWTRGFAWLLAMPLIVPVLWHGWRTRRVSPALAGLLLYLAFELSWSIFAATIWPYDPPPTSPAEARSLALSLGRILIVAYFVFTHLVTLQTFGPIWLLFAVGLAIRPAGAWRGAAIAVVLGLLVVCAIGYAEVGRTGWSFFLYDAVRRLLMSYVPLAVLVVAAAPPVRRLFSVQLEPTGEASPA